MRRHRTALGNPAVLFTNDEGVVGVEAGPGGRIYFSDAHGIYRLSR
jgi:hypothetical protein